uniref:Uncharacterized protein n=1 Tax=Anguilla anguilla TaxID=7936 RepID=A0A0E9XB60_ANGAN
MHLNINCYTVMYLLKRRYCN